jgi:hypothetical protein
VFKRKVITRSGARVRGYFASVKSYRLIPWESPLEREALVIAEFDPRIVRMREHQQLMEIDAEEDAFDAYPDFVFEYEDADPLIVEVKSDRHARDPEIQARLTRIARHIELQGGRYEVQVEKEIRRLPRLETLEDLLTFRRPRAFGHLIERNGVAELLRWSGEFPLYAATQRLQSRPLVLQLIANDMLHANFDEELASSALLTVNEGARHAYVSH